MRAMSGGVPQCATLPLTPPLPFSVFIRARGQTKQYITGVASGRPGVRTVVRHVDPVADTGDPFLNYILAVAQVGASRQPWRSAESFSRVVMGCLTPPHTCLPACLSPGNAWYIRVAAPSCGLDCFVCRTPRRPRCTPSAGGTTSASPAPRCCARSTQARHVVRVHAPHPCLPAQPFIVARVSQRL